VEFGVIFGVNFGVFFLQFFFQMCYEVPVLLISQFGMQKTNYGLKKREDDIQLQMPY
jgi:hypothetical protein